MRVRVLLTAAACGLFLSSVPTAAFGAVEAAVAPGAPRSVDAATTEGSVTVAWRAPLSGTVSAYAVTCSGTDGGAPLSRTVASSVRSAKLPGLPANRTYRCSVTASGPGGTSAAAQSSFVQHAQTRPGVLSTAMHLPALTGQRVFAYVRTSTLVGCSNLLTLVGPGGRTLAETCPDGDRVVPLDGPAVGASGTAQVRLRSMSTATGSAELVAATFRDVVAALPLPAATRAVALSTPGQDARLTIDGRQGQQVSVTISRNTIQQGALRLLGPDGTELLAADLFAADAFLDTVALPLTGRYTLLIDPAALVTGQLTVSVADVPINAGPLRLGVPTHVDVGVAGQNAVRTFTAAAGQRVAVTVTASTFTGGSVQVLTPDGHTFRETFLFAADAYLETFPLSVTGVYTLLIDPWEQSTGGLDVVVTDIPANTGSMTIGAAPTLIVLAHPGEQAVRTFQGTAGQQVTMTYSGNTFASGTGRGEVVLRLPDGNVTGSSGTLASESAYVDAVELPVTGTYTLFVDAWDGATGQLSVALQAVPPNTGTITVDAPAQPIVVSAAGQNPSRTFSGLAGDVVTIDVSASTVGQGLLFLKRGNGEVARLDMSGPVATIPSVQLPVTGSYEVLIDPFDQGRGSFALSVHH